MEFETMLITSMALVIAILAWWILGLMDDRRRLTCALAVAQDMLSPACWEDVIEAYDNALHVDEVLR